MTYTENSLPFTVIAYIAIVCLTPIVLLLNYNFYKLKNVSVIKKRFPILVLIQNGASIIIGIGGLFEMYSLSEGGKKNQNVSEGI